MKNVFVGAICGAIGIIVYKEVVKAKNRAYVEGYKDGIDVCKAIVEAKIKEEES